MTLKEYLRELWLMERQYGQEEELYPLINMLLREGDNTKHLSIRDIHNASRAKALQSRKLLKGAGSFPDIVILDPSFSNNGKIDNNRELIYGCVEAKSLKDGKKFPTFNEIFKDYIHINRTIRIEFFQDENTNADPSLQIRCKESELGKYLENISKKCRKRISKKNLGDEIFKQLYGNEMKNPDFKNMFSENNCLKLYSDGFTIEKSTEDVSTIEKSTEDVSNQFNRTIRIEFFQDEKTKATTSLTKLCKESELGKYLEKISKKCRKRISKKNLGDEIFKQLYGNEMNDPNFEGMFSDNNCLKFCSDGFTIENSTEDVSNQLIGEILYFKNVIYTDGLRWWFFQLVKFDKKYGDHISLRKELQKNTVTEIDVKIKADLIGDFTELYYGDRRENGLKNLLSIKNLDDLQKIITLNDLSEWARLKYNLSLINWTGKTDHNKFIKRDESSGSGNVTDKEE